MLLSKQHKLKNGLTVIYCKTQHRVEFEISMHIQTGSRHEIAENSGVSHFLEHMMFRGSSRYPNSIILARELEKFGGEINAITSSDTTTYWIKGDSEKLYDAIPCFAEFFLYPNFADIEIERGVILEELASDYNDQGACIDVDHLAMKAVFQNHPLGNPIIGNYESVQNMSVSDLKKKRETYYVPSLCVLTVYSSQNEDEVLKKIESSFDCKWNHVNSSSTIYKKDEELSYKHNPLKKTKNFLSLQNNLDNQYSMKLIFPTTGGLSEKAIQTVFLQRILDDGICTRLPGNIREVHGLVYDISCDTQFFYEVGILGVDVIVSDDRLESLLNKMTHEFNLLLNEPPSLEEIEHIRYRYLFDMKQIMQNPSRLLNRHANSIFMNSPLSIQDEIDVIKTIDAQTIHNVAKQTFIQNYRGLALIGPKAKKHRNAVEKFLKIFDN